jgi:hypothetical protein
VFGGLLLYQFAAVPGKVAQVTLITAWNKTAFE